MKSILMLSVFFFTAPLTVAKPWIVKCQRQKIVLTSEMNQITPPPQYGSSYRGRIVVDTGFKQSKYRSEMGCEMSSCSILGFNENGRIVVEIPLTDPIAPGTSENQDTLRVKISFSNEEWSGMMNCKKN